jgi:CPA1 family monovalent cation:H+ antiporter
MHDALGPQPGFDLEYGLAVIVSLLLVAMAVAIAIRRFRLPYTIVLVLVGMVLAFSRKVPGLQLLQLGHAEYAAVSYNLLLPILLFEAALNLNIGVVGLLVRVLLGVPWLEALLLGAIISPTDPLSVVATFRQLGVSRRLTVLVEGESLFNDAVGLVVFTILLGAARAGTSLSVTEGLYELLIVSAGGVVIGAVLGLVASWITYMVDDHLIEITLSTILAYGAFLIAENISIAGVHFSGVTAVVVAGLLMGNYGRPAGMSATTIVALDTFWEYLAFVANSLIFLLIGIELSALEYEPHLWSMIAVIGAVYLISLLARTLVSHTGGLTLGTRDHPIPVAWRHVIMWGGLKGALSMIMVLQVPRSLRMWSDFDLLLSATFGVVFLSLILQGLTIRRFAKWLNLSGRSDLVDQYEKLAARVIGGRAALTTLTRLRDSHVLTSPIHDELAEPYRDQIAEADAAMVQLQAEHPHLKEIQLRDALRQAHHAEKSALLDAYQRGIITEDALHAMVVALDDRHHALEAEHEISPDVGSSDSPRVGHTAGGTYHDQPSYASSYAGTRQEACELTCCRRHAFRHCRVDAARRPRGAFSVSLGGRCRIVCRCPASEPENLRTCEPATSVQGASP